MIRIALEMSDLAWKGVFESYIRNNHSEFINIVTPPSHGDGKQAEAIDVIIVDRSDAQADTASGPIVVNSLLSGHHVLTLCEDRLADYSSFEVYKYEKADRLVKRIRQMLEGKTRESAVHHIVIGTSHDPMHSRMDTDEMCRELSSQGKKALIVRLAGYDLLDTWNRELGADPFGRLTYYAMLSEDKVLNNLQKLIFHHPDGYDWIPKPYPFDANAYDEAACERILVALESQSEYDIVLWDCGNLYARSIHPLYKSAADVVWLSQFESVQTDPLLTAYSDLTGCRIDLKTHFHSESEWGDRKLRKFDPSEVIRKILERGTRQ